MAISKERERPQAERDDSAPLEACWSLMSGGVAVAQKLGGKLTLPRPLDLSQKTA